MHPLSANLQIMQLLRHTLCHHLQKPPICQCQIPKTIQTSVTLLSSDEDFSAPVTSESPLAVTVEDLWALLNGTPFSETYHQSLSLSQFGDVKAGSSTDNTCKAPGSLVSIKTNNEPNGEDVGIATVLGQSQESAPNTFDERENEVSTAQDTLLVTSQPQPSAVLDKSAGSNHKELSQQLLVANKKLEETVKVMEGKLALAEQEKVQLQKGLESLLQRNKSLVEESENLTEALAKQREKYELLLQLQEQHNKEMEKIQKAVHDALHEEYKDASEMKTLMEKEEVIFSGTYPPNLTNLDSTVQSSGVCPYRYIKPAPVK